MRISHSAKLKQKLAIEETKRMLKEKIKIKHLLFCHGQIPEAQGSGSVLSTRPLNCQSGKEHNRLKKPQQLGEDEVQSSQISDDTKPSETKTG